MIGLEGVDSGWLPWFPKIALVEFVSPQLPNAMVFGGVWRCAVSGSGFAKPARNFEQVLQPAFSCGPLCCPSMVRLPHAAVA
jgi:hypothetical protein